MARMVMLAGLVLLAIAAIATTTTNAAGSYAHTHECQHDTPEMQEALYGPIIEDGTGLRKLLHPAHAPISPQRYRFSPQSEPVLDTDESAKEQRRSFHPSSAEPFRVVFSTADLDDPTKYCEDAVETNPDFKGSTIQCTTDHIFTAAKKAIYKDKVIPAVMETMSRFLSVNRVAGNLVVGTQCTNGFTTPSDHTSTGVPNADFVLYAAAAPTLGSNVAFAGYCSLDGNDRPVTGKMNLGPKFIVWDDNDKASQRKLVHTVIHELLHALGFSGTYISSKYPANSLKNEVRRGQTIEYMSTAKAVEKAREHFNCTTLTGPEIEDEGGSGTAGSHWERRTHFDDIMAGYLGDKMFISGVTLGMLADSGHYFPDWTQAESPLWMRGIGCGAHDSPCNTTAGGLGAHFCLTPNEQGCNYDFSAHSVCSVQNFSSAIPSYNQYYPEIPEQGGSASVMNYCPMMTGYSNRQCNNPFNSAANSSSYYYATDGRCFVKSGSPYCYRARCFNGTIVEFQFANDIGGEWHTCHATGDIVNDVACPDPNVFCTSDLYYSNVTTTTTPTTTSNTTSTTSATNASTTNSSSTSSNSTTSTTATTTTTTFFSTTPATTNQFLDNTTGGFASTSLACTIIVIVASTIAATLF